MQLVLLAGGAGFIGSHVADPFSARGDRAVVLDDFNGFHDPSSSAAPRRRSSRLAKSVTVE